MVQAIKMAWAEESKQGRRFALAAAPRDFAHKKASPTGSYPVVGWLR
jgi:hypothetical protein